MGIDKAYWYTWAALLILTLGMVSVGSAAIPGGVIAVLLILGMCTKATLIGSNFMHLRYEKWPLILTVVVGILFTALALFLGIAPDGIRILSLGRH